MKKSERFGLVLTPIEKLVLSRMAQKEPELSQSAIIRRLIRKAAKDAGLWPPQPQTTEVANNEQA